MVKLLIPSYTMVSKTLKVPTPMIAIKASLHEQVREWRHHHAYVLTRI